jgi:peptidoglycan/xylan/chitin deacetylase (PgdA/CDA1 family)
MIPNQTLAAHKWARSIRVSGIDEFYKVIASERGWILQFHTISPEPESKFAPYGHLGLTEKAFAEIIHGLKKRKRIAFVSMDEVPERLAARRSHEKFCAVTFDHGYRSIRRKAVPILQRSEVPYTIYVAGEMVDERAGLWWKTLEHLIAEKPSLAVPVKGGATLLDCSSPKAKNEAISRVVTFLMDEVDESERSEWVGDLCATYGVDPEETSRETVLDWGQLAELAQDPLCTIGAMGIAHRALARVPSEEDVTFEIEAGLTTVEAGTGVRPNHFAYPFGQRWAAGKREFMLAADAGLATAVTTRQGALYKGHRKHLTALPRITISGPTNRLKHVSTLMGGLPTRMASGFRKLNVS